MMINRRLISLVHNSMKYIVLTIVGQWVALLSTIAIIVSLAFTVENLVADTLTEDMLLTIVLVVLSGIAVKCACTVLVSKTSFYTAEEVKHTLRTQIYTKVLRLGPRYQDCSSTSELIQVAVEGVEQLESYFSRYLPQFFYSLLAPLTLFVVLSFFSFPAALTLLICVPLIPLAIIAVQRVAKKLMKRYWGSYTDLGASFLENIQGLTTLKIYQADEAKNEEMNTQAETFRTITMKVLRMQLNSITIMDSIAYGGSVLGIIVALFAFMGAQLSLTGCIAIILLASEFFIPLRLLGSYFHVAMNGVAASERIFKLLDAPEPEEGSVNELLFDGVVSFEHVDFSYDMKRQVLHDLSFSLTRGITALVGESGCGKSTVAAIITGRLKPDKGSISLNNLSLEQYTQQLLTKTMTYLGHDSYLFKGSVRDNLLMGDAQASEALMWEALDKVNLSDYFKQEKGLDTKLSEEASNLSGGQRQRLAFARALLHDSSLYIFDEPTSNIDVESENDITALIWELAKTKTILFISHRLANVVPADTIYVMDAGRIIESGKHEILLAQNGHYAQMFQTQVELERIAQKEVVSA